MAAKLAAACAALALVATVPARSASAATPRDISHARLLAIALRVAKADREPRPRDIRAARGTFARALRIVAPRGTRIPPSPAGGPRAPGGPLSPVFLVAMNGHFAATSTKFGVTRTEHGRVLELVIDARAGFVEVLSVVRAVPVPLSRLGPVFGLG